MGVPMTCPRCKQDECVCVCYYCGRPMRELNGGCGNVDASGHMWCFVCNRTNKRSPAMSSDNRLGITPGEWMADGAHRIQSPHYDICHMDSVPPHIEDRHGVRKANADLIADAGTTANRTGKLPSELEAERDAAEARVLRICKCGGMVSGPLGRPCDKCGSTVGELVETAWFELKAERDDLARQRDELREALQMLALEVGAGLIARNITEGVMHDRVSAARTALANTKDKP